MALGNLLGQLQQMQQRQGGPQAPLGPLQAQLGAINRRRGGQLPPGIDPRAVAADPRGFAQQQAQLRQAGGDPRRAAMLQRIRQRLGGRGGPGGQLGGLGAMLQQLMGQRQQGQGLAPRQALAQRLSQRNMANRGILKGRLA